MKTTIRLFLALITLMPMTAHADSYTQLWKAATAAEESDKPRTEIDILRQIEEKARKERAYGQLLKAALREACCAKTISRDSLQPAVERLAQQAAEAKDVALKAVYHSALGHIYANNSDLDDHAKERSREYFDLSLAAPDALAKASATGYQPVVIDGDDSRYFGDDLLHVLGIEAGRWQLLHDWYKAHGNREAACLCALRLVQAQRPGTEMALRKSKYLQTVDSLLDEYKDLAVAGDVAIEHYTFMDQATDASADEKIAYINYALSRWGAWPRMNVLRNAQGRMTLPSFHVSIGSGVLLPGQGRDVVVMSVVNVQTLTMTIHRLQVDGDTDLNPSNNSDYKKLAKLIQGAPVQTQTRRYVGIPNYRETRDTLHIDPLPVGMYLVELSTDNSQIRTERLLLHVSNLTVMHEELLGKNIRLVAVNATTGQPVAGAKIRITTRAYYYKEDPVVKTLTADGKGEAVYTYDKRKPNEIWVYTDGDRAMAETSMQTGFSYNAPTTNTREVMNVYTDRSLYRPGQQVQVGLIAYTRKGEETTHVGAGRKVTLTLHDANSKKVEEADVTTDDFGMAQATFQLPQSGLTGLFHVYASQTGSHASASFAVEEYKRPTFEVAFEKVTEKYQNGDTVTVRGTARSFAGVPVQDAKVAVKVVRRPARWWWWARTDRDQEKTIAIDTLTTDAGGQFELRVPMTMPEVWNERQTRYYSFDITAEVTDLAGETRHGETHLPLSDKATALTCNLPGKAVKDSLHTLTFRYTNNAGEPIDSPVSYRFDNGTTHKGKANQPLELGQHLAPGRHTLTATCGADTLRQEIVIFTMNDKRPVVETHDWWYASGSEFSRNGKPTYIQVGASDADQHIVYTIVAGDRILENGCIDQSNALTTRAFTYKEEYGEGLLLTYAWVKDGTLHRHRATIAKPLPDKRLLLTWKTFRDRLKPGQKEEWTLHVTKPDGQPAEAQLMAVLYDKSLDMIRQHQWYFGIYQSRRLPSTTWNGMVVGDRSVYGEMPYRTLSERSLDFSHLDTSVIPGSRAYYDRMFQHVTLLESRPMALGASPIKMKGNANEMVLSRAMDGAQVESDEEPKASDGGQEAKSEEPRGEEQVRENLSETAFFLPGLTTDGAGNVAIRFTLPESVTTWRMMGLAHDRDVNYGMIEGETVAQKTVMVQPNVPRFLRSGDKATIATRIINTSEKAVSGTATLTLIDAETEKRVYTQQRPYSIAAGQTTGVSFDYTPAMANAMLVCRITAEGKDYSDGEQHYLPILPDREWVTNTRPFTQNGAGTLNIDLQELFPAKSTDRKLTVEYTNNPTWLMVQALPSIATCDDHNAISLATAYYANAIANHILQQSPTIKEVVKLWKRETGSETSLMSSLEKNQELKALVLSETPWVMDADREADQKQSLINYFDEIQVGYRQSTYLDKLKKLQNPDGSFSWWPDMPGSRYMTTSVCETLTRLAQMTGEQRDTQRIIADALDYMEREAHEEVKYLRKLEKKEKHLRPSEMAIDYMYVRALRGDELRGRAAEDVEYLVKLFEKKTTVFSIYGKARAAIILAWSKRTGKAQEYLESIRQHTVYKEEMGRYFDTWKALYSWRDYRIPSQVAAIEALKRLAPTDRKTITEMQRWLLQEKRTQAWDTPINSVDAVYAFLDGESTKLGSMDDPLATLKVDGRTIDNSKATAGLGYVKEAFTTGAMKTFSAEKTTTGTSWGAVYAQFMQQTTDVASASSGLTVKREIMGGDQLKVGDRVRVRLTITAERDFDFVQVVDKRAACLEPVGQRSGYHYGYYCTPRDNSTNYYFDVLPKGKHVIETEYYIDRPGEYQTGTCTVQCAYSPEYMGREGGQTVEVKK